MVEKKRAEQAKPEKRAEGLVSTGLARLDKLLGGGFPQNTAILLSGVAGSGKTLAGLNFLAGGVSRGERCCYVSLNETRDELLRASEKIENLKILSGQIDKNFVIEQVILGGKINLEYFTKMFAQYPKIDRLVIDNVNKLLIFAENQRDYRLHLAELVRYLKEKVQCTLLICETDRDNIDSGNGESFEADGVLHIAFSELEPMRLLSVHKMRYAAIEPRVKHEFVIDSKELRLSNTKVV